MPGNPVKRGNYGDWATINHPPIKSGCGGCIHYQEDGSCAVLPVIAHGLGKYAYKHCKEYTPNEKSLFHSTVQKDCPFCKYVEAQRYYVCFQSDSRRYSYECESCEWFRDEYLHSPNKATHPVVIQSTVASPSTPTTSKAKSETQDKRATKHVSKTDSTIKHQQTKMPRSSLSPSSPEQKDETPNTEHIQPLNTLISEYEKRLQELAENHKNEIAQKDRIIQEQNSQLSEQSICIEQLKLENERLHAELSLIKEESAAAPTKANFWTAILKKIFGRE